MGTLTILLVLLQLCHLSSEAEYLKSISSSLRFRDKEWQRIDGKKGRGKEGAEEEEGHFPHRRYHCTWERDGGTAKGERREEAISQIEKLR